MVAAIGMGAPGAHEHSLFPAPPPRHRGCNRALRGEVSMRISSFVGIGLVFAFAGCSAGAEPEPDPLASEAEQTGSASPRAKADGGSAAVAGGSSLAGLVHLAGGRPVAGASVTLDDKVAQTDAAGRFRFEDVAPGAHTLSTAWGKAPCVAKTEQRIDVKASVAGEADVQIGGPDAIVRKTLVINMDPIIESQQKLRLHQVKKWSDPKEVNRGYVDSLAQCSNGSVVYDVVDWIDSDVFPIKADGFRYTDAAYVGSQWHQPDAVSYPAIVKDFNLVARVNSGEIDEVIIWGGPYFGFWESHMVGPTAYFVNSGGTVRTDVKRNFVIMGLNYERSLADAIHSYGHRFESIMTKVYGRWDSKAPAPNAWELLAATNADRPGSSGCGNVHVPPNGKDAYDYGNDVGVTSRCEDYAAWPKLSGAKSVVGYKSWKITGTDAQLDYLQYWFAHIPRAARVNADKKQNNWWKYAADFNAYPESR
jgi:hypothetical protein